MLLLGLILAGCGGHSANYNDPLFSGPWAADFRQAYNKTEDPFLKSVLEDGVISDEEFSEVKQAYLKCMESLGFAGVTINDDGSGGFTPPQGADFTPEEINGMDKGCLEESGVITILPLYNGPRVNPDNIPFETLMADCLVRFGLESPGYSGNDYLKDFQDGLWDGNPQFRACQADPLNARP